jgi:hypothetical protein
MAKSQHRKQQQPLKPQAKCIFCQGYGMTKQHIWPNWMNAVISERGDTHLQTLTRFKSLIDSSLQVEKPLFNEKNGDIGTRKVRLVCAQCNNNWMSRIEDAASSVISSLMAQKTTTLPQAEQAKLISWICLMAIVAEFTDIPTKAISYEQRMRFMDTHLPPEGWVIWAGKYEGREWSPRRYRHIGVHAVKREDYARDPINYSGTNASKNLQTTTIVADHLAIQVISTTDPTLEKALSDFQPLKMVQLWPSTQIELDWASLIPLSDGEMRAISSYLADIR